MGQDTFRLSANSTYNNINFSDQNCLTSITQNAFSGETGPDGQNIFGHIDVLINDIFL